MTMNCANICGSEVLNLGRDDISLFPRANTAECLGH